MASSNSSSSNNGNGPVPKPYDINISAGGAQARLHAAGAPPEGTGMGAVPQEIRSALASTPSSSVLDASAGQINPSANFSSAGAQARAAAAGAAPAGTHAAHIGPANVSSTVSPLMSNLNAAGIGKPGSTNNPGGYTGTQTTSFAPTTDTSSAQPEIIHALNTINELDDRSAPGTSQTPIPPFNASATDDTPPTITSLNTAEELRQPGEAFISSENPEPIAAVSSPSSSASAAFGYSPGGAAAQAAAAGQAPLGTTPVPSSIPSSTKAAYEAETRAPPAQSPSEIAQNVSPGGYAAIQHAAGAVPRGTGHTVPGGAAAYQGTAPAVAPASTEGAVDPNVSQAGLAAKAGAAQQPPAGTAYWGKKQFSTLAGSRGPAAASRAVVRGATRVRGPLIARVGAVGVAGLLLGSS